MNGMVIFHSYITLPAGKSHQIPLSRHFPLGFPMVFSMVSLVILHDRSSAGVERMAAGPPRFARGTVS